MLVVTMEDSGKWQGKSNRYYEEACEVENEIEKITEEVTLESIIFMFLADHAIDQKVLKN